MRIRTLLLSLNIGLAGIGVQVAVTQTSAQNDWPSYGRDPGAQRYSPLTQINASNVSTLVQAWKYETRPASSVAKSQQQSKTTPLMVNSVVYFVTPFQSLVAVEPETGKTLWTFDHQHAARTSRGIAY
jgi:glucose dehydrogenase